MADETPKPRRPRAARAVRPAAPAAKRTPGPRRPAALPAPQVPLELAAPKPPLELPAHQQGRAGGAYDWIWRTGLLNCGAIVRRELGSYFVSPIGYVVGSLLVLLVSPLGYLFPIGNQSPVSIDQVYYWVVYLMVFLAPLYTMRLLAEERRSGTLEILLTSPVRDWEVVIGKWLAAWLFFVITTLFVFVYAILIIYYQPTKTIVQVLGHNFEVGNIDYGVLLAGYIGMLLAGATFVAIGLWASSLTSNQIIAAVIGMGCLVGIWYLFPILSVFLPSPYGVFLQYLGGSNRYTSFNQGRLVLKDAVYFVTVIVGALFLTTRVLESRKWR